MLRFVFLVLSIILCLVNSGEVIEKFKVKEVRPRIVTPTSKTVRIKITSDYMFIPHGTIYDITGTEIAKMVQEGEYEKTPATEEPYIYLTWTPGSNIPTGVYIYQIECSGQIYNGTIVVAR